MSFGLDQIYFKMYFVRFEILQFYGSGENEVNSKILLLRIIIIKGFGILGVELYSQGVLRIF